MAGGGFYLICVLWHVSNLRLITSLLIIILLLPPPWALRGLSANVTACVYVKGFQSTVIVLILAIFIH